jgi:hypothetical protein
MNRVERAGDSVPRTPWDLSLKSQSRRQPARAGADAPTQACGIWANRGAQVVSQRCPILRVGNRILNKGRVLSKVQIATLNEKLNML